MSYLPASSSFPTSLDSPDDPAGTDVTGTFDHAGLDSYQNDAIEKLQAKVGVTSSAVSSSLDYKLSNVSSSNPGHKHTLANSATDVTSTAAELNALDGITATVAELNKLDGASANVTPTNLNTLTDSSSYTILHYHSLTRIVGNALSAEQNPNNEVKPAITVNNGTYQDDTTLDFDADSEENDEWFISIPSGITITSATLYIYYRMTSATSGAVVWSCFHQGVNDGETWDTGETLTTDTFTADTVPDAITKMAIHSKVLTTTGWTAGDHLIFGIMRSAEDAGDTATGDAKLMHWLLEIK